MNSPGRDVQTLFEIGAVGALGDDQLLDRFVDGRDGAIFEHIVARHGPMVWGVCWRTLRHHHDAEEAFQATFLVLARKASSIRPRSKLGGWLHGVATRTALRARSARARRQAREQSTSAVSDQAIADADPRDSLAELDSALAALPDQYRVPIVLCELQGKSHKQAAEILGWPVGTVSGRLSRGRTVLAARLVARGIAPAASALALDLARDAHAAGPGRILLQHTRELAAAALTGSFGPSAAVSSGVISLSREVSRTMFLTKLKTVAIVAVSALAVVTGGVQFGLRISSAMAQQAPAPNPGGTKNAAGQAQASADQRKKPETVTQESQELMLKKRQVLDELVPLLDRLSYARQRRDAARKVFEQVNTRLQELKPLGGVPDDLPEWSRRWMAAELDLAQTPRAQLAALEAHLERTKALELIADQYASTGQGPRETVEKMKFHRLEAQELLTQFDARHPGVRSAQPARGAAPQKSNPAQAGKN